MKILIVDDNMIARKVLEYNLTKYRYQVVLATTGMEAMKVLESNSDVGLIITDIMMPDMDGLELLRQVRSNSELNDTPVILCSALSDTELIKKAAKLGCRYYVVKPVQIKVLLQMVQEALENRNRNKPLLDAEQTREKLGMDQESFISLVVSFEKFVNEKILIIEQKTKSLDMNSVRGDLATLHENAVLLGVGRLSNILADVLTGVDLNLIAAEDYQVLLKELKWLSSSLKKMNSGFESTQ